MSRVAVPERIDLFAAQLDGPLWSALTPQDLFCHLAGRPDIAWLDSAEFDKAEKSWSYILYSPRVHTEVSLHDVLSISSKVQSGEIHTGDLQLFSQLFRPSRPTVSKPPGAPPFCGGWVGFMSYDTFSNPRLRHGTPLMSLSLFPAVLAYSHDKKEWWVAATSLSATSPNKLADETRNNANQLIEQIAPINKLFEKPSALPRRSCVSNCTRSQYEKYVSHALEYIRNGDIYQINLAQRLRVPWALPPELLYLRLRQESPARFGAYLGSGLVSEGKALCSISPELFLSVDGRTVTTRPIKGTRPRASSAAQNLKASDELSTSAKERAELNMIVDLERNDLGKVCEYGSVEVLSPGEIEELPTLLHRVATVRGTLKRNCSPARLLRATFPGGSVTGAPKIRAMQIINELEPSPRGPYCGAIGWLGLDGNMELSIAIRTALVDADQQTAYYHAGSGIVADSDPRAEYEETLHKAAAFFRATNSELAAEFRER